MKCFTVIIAALLLAMPSAFAADAPDPAETPPRHPPRADAIAASWREPDPSALKQWQDMRFGLFIHWGPVSLSGERISWSRGAPTPIEVYDNLYKQFDAPEFDAGAWASTAKAAGMKYVVLTAKHHDGFCLWDTKETDYNVMNSPLKRDVVRELADACRRQGLAFGTYYSVCDWHNPDFPRTGVGGSERRETSDIEAYRRFLRAQVTELVKNYGPNRGPACGNSNCKSSRGKYGRHSIAAKRSGPSARFVSRRSPRGTCA